MELFVFCFFFLCVKSDKDLCIARCSTTFRRKADITWRNDDVFSGLIHEEPATFAFSVWGLYVYKTLSDHVLVLCGLYFLYHIFFFFFIQVLYNTVVNTRVKPPSRVANIKAALVKTPEETFVTSVMNNEKNRQHAIASLTRRGETIIRFVVTLWLLFHFRVLYWTQTEE